MRGDRAVAGIIALVATTGIIIQFFATSANEGGPLAALFIMSRFFTIWSNLAVAIVYGGYALGKARFSCPRLVGGVTLSIVLVGVVYFFMLRGLLHLSGGSLLANQIMHYVTPVLAPLHWLVFARKGELRWTDPFWWACFPLVYLPYALVRGMLGDKYAYPFINPVKLGWVQVTINVVVISAGFLAVGWALVAVDRLMARRTQG